MKKSFTKNISILILFIAVFYSMIVFTHSNVTEIPWHLTQISIEGAWDITQGSNNITIAIIDTGVDFNHSSLNQSSWVNSDEIPNNGLDDDKNGYIDDLVGWDFYSNDNNPGFSSNDTINYHGTFCSGLIVAKHLDQKEAWGLAPNVKIMSLRIFGPNPLNEGFNGDRLVEAINYAIDNGADIINLSLESPIGSFTLLDSIKRAVMLGIPVLAATGNYNGGGKNQTSFPARYDQVIAVGATNFNQEKTDYSNYGDGIEIMAPGGDMNYPLISTVPNDKIGTGYGTSFSTPQVAALIALMKSVRTNLTVDEIRYILHNTAIDINSTGWDVYTGWGVINCTAALSLTLNFTGIPNSSRNSPWGFLSVFELAILTLALVTIGKIIKKKGHN